MIVAGCGYTGTRLALARRAAGRPVQALVASVASRRALVAHGIDAVAWDLDAVASGTPRLASADVVVYLIPPPARGEDDPRLARFLTALPWRPRRIVYASTTGVYGDRGGATVDETAAPAPRTGRARRRLAAETALREWCADSGVEWVILRVPGIYGPGRLQLDTLAAGRPLLRADLAGPGNRIQVDDLVRCLAAAARTAHAHRVFNVGDGDHASNTEFVTEVARQCGRPAPPQADAETLRASVSARRWSFMRESRRVDTTAMRETLGVKPVYARMSAGIAASLVRT